MKRIIKKWFYCKDHGRREYIDCSNPECIKDDLKVIGFIAIACTLIVILGILLV